jgi:tyrosyl-tRNA synthetase
MDKENSPVKRLNEQELNYILSRGVAEIIVKEELIHRLKAGERLRLKEGFDPSFPDIHLGHMVGLRKLRQFQEAGHQVILIVGDWTAQIGDPSGVSVTRPMLTAEQVKSNADTYMKQFFKIVDKEKTEVRWQSEWFGKFTLADVIRLASKFTIAQFLQRDDFAKRYAEGKPISITEFLYPLLQAHDSVAIHSDVEFGGVDQKFNLLVGRELQAIVGQKPQQTLMTPLLIGTDGCNKMSKSKGNYIAVNEVPAQMFGKVMSIPDSLIMNYYELLTDIPDKELEEVRQTLANSSVNPMELKKKLGVEIVAQLHGREAGLEAECQFSRVFQKKEAPEEINEFAVSFSVLGADSSGVDISKLLVSINQVKSRSEAIRLIGQGGISINGEKIAGNVALLKSGSIIKVGKHRFVKIVNTDK